MMPNAEVTVVQESPETTSYHLLPMRAMSEHDARGFQLFSCLFSPLFSSLVSFTCYGQRNAKELTGRNRARLGRLVWCGSGGDATKQSDRRDDIVAGSGRRAQQQHGEKFKQHDLHSGESIRRS